MDLKSTPLTTRANWLLLAMAGVLLGEHAPTGLAVSLLKIRWATGL